MKKLLRYSLVTLGIILLINGIIMRFVSNFNIGNIIEIGIGSLMTCYGIFYDNINTKCTIGIFKIVKIMFFSLLMAMCVVGLIIFASKDVNVAKFNENAVIVLGCGINGNKISLALKKRLDKCIEYIEKNREAIIIVSGGQGPQETITEALAMERYLIDKGVAGSKIIKEDNSTSTYENFKLSKKILDEIFITPYNIAYITNDYHSYRAGEIAKVVGFDAKSYSSGTEINLLPSTYSREVLALIKFWIFKD